MDKVFQFIFWTITIVLLPVVLLVVAMDRGGMTKEERKKITIVEQIRQQLGLDVQDEIK